MAFNVNIRALLDTYANCASLLKSFGRGREDNGTLAPDTEHEYTRLRKALKSDRSLIKRAYSSQLSESGSRLKKGDARAVTAIDRILKRLRNAIARLLRRSSKKNGLDLDYRSLMTLSNASRHETIKTIESLSRRLGSPSQSSVATSPNPKPSSKASSPSRHKPKPPANSKSSTPGSKPKKEVRKNHSPSKKPPVAAKEGKTTNRPQKIVRLRKGAPAVSPPPPKSADAKHQAQPSQAIILCSENQRLPQTAGPNRISILSFASDSTKLGEISHRRWQSALHSTATDSDEGYNVRPVFPLKPRIVEVRERRFFGLFGRKREA